MRETGLVALTFPGSGQPVQCDGVTTGQWPQSGRYKYTAGASAWCRVLACLAPGVLGRASNEHSRSCIITEKAPTRTVFTFKNLQIHYAKWALIHGT